MRADTLGGSDGQRGVSNVLSIVLLFAIVVGGIAVVVSVGATALDDTRNGLDTSRAEKALTQFDSRSAMVALGGTSRQGIDLAAGGNTGYHVDADAGWMNVTIRNESADYTQTIVNVTTLGAVVYENGRQSIAYQGGGVWQRTEAGVRMLSPPEFHFRDATLTLPIIDVRGQSTLGSGAVVTKDGASVVKFPDRVADENFTNPLDDGQVNVTVHSEYYRAWGRFFEQRTEGNVTYDHTRETATAELVVPFNESFDNTVATTKAGGITMNRNNPKPSPHETGVNYPLIDDRIENKIETCEDDDDACNDIPSDDTITTEDTGIYYTDADYSDALEIDEPGGDLTIVVNGDFEPNGVEIDSEYNVTILVRESFTVTRGSNKELNPSGPAGNFSVAVHSDGSVDANGNYKLVGLLYAPGSHCDLNGGGSMSPNIVGGIVCETVDFNGNPNDFQHDPSIEDTELGLNVGITPITYLHVTENPIEVDNN